MHLLVIHDNVLTAFVSVIKQSAKAYGPLAFIFIPADTCIIHHYIMKERSIYFFFA